MTNAPLQENDVEYNEGGQESQVSSKTVMTSFPNSSEIPSQTVATTQEDSKDGLVNQGPILDNVPNDAFEENTSQIDAFNRSVDEPQEELLADPTLTASIEVMVVSSSLSEQESVLLERQIQKQSFESDNDSTSEGKNGENESDSSSDSKDQSKEEEFVSDSNRDSSSISSNDNSIREETNTMETLSYLKDQSEVVLATDLATTVASDDEARSTAPINLMVSSANVSNVRSFSDTMGHRILDPSPQSYCASDTESEEIFVSTKGSTSSTLKRTVKKRSRKQAKRTRKTNRRKVTARQRRGHSQKRSVRRKAKLPRRSRRKFHPRKAKGSRTSRKSTRKSTAKRIVRKTRSSSNKRRASRTTKKSPQKTRKRPQRVSKRRSTASTSKRRYSVAKTSRSSTQVVKRSKV